MPTFRAPDQLSRHSSIACPKCGGKATLMRRTPDAFKRDGKTEKWTYECAACGYKIEHTVQT